MGIVYGRVADYHDTRDLMLTMPAHLAPHLPAKVDLKVGFSLPIYDQGSIGSCTANTGVKYRRWLYQRSSATPQNDHDLSRLFLYYQERALPWNNSVEEDSGAQMRDIFVTLNKVGVCPEIDQPYDVAKFTKTPSAQAITNAIERKIGAYHRITDLYSLRACMGSGPVGYPVAIGFPVFQSFEDIGPNGKMKMPKRGEKILGGHAVFAWGYDDIKKVVKIDNSWGASWGDKGSFYMPYAFLNKYWQQIDVWMGHLGHWRPQ